ncbi:MAG: 5-formyltetrahydrofolate cyclo-ligase [Sideroxydans sp.]|nr:5-formyltetrahydrofolate cyclo-ligase [Sideroxydans sp.]
MSGNWAAILHKHVRHAPMTPQQQKQTLRQQILSRRDALPHDQRAAHSASIIERLLAMPQYQRAKVVLGYMNFGHEFASELWVKRVLADGKKLILPRANPVTRLLELYWVEDIERQLAPGMFGIREPIPELSTMVLSLNALEFVLLPGVAFTREGARLGYGGGFYDKLLARVTHRPVLVAGAFGMQLVQDIPQESTDRKVEWLVTENETICCKQESEQTNGHTTNPESG